MNLVYKIVQNFSIWCAFTCLMQIAFLKSAQNEAQTKTVQLLNKFTSFKPQYNISALKKITFIKIRQSHKLRYHIIQSILRKAIC